MTSVLLQFCQFFCTPMFYFVVTVSQPPLPSVHYMSMYDPFLSSSLITEQRCPTCTRPKEISIFRLWTRMKSDRTTQLVTSTKFLRTHLFVISNTNDRCPTSRRPPITLLLLQRVSSGLSSGIALENILLRSRILWPVKWMASIASVCHPLPPATPSLPETHGVCIEPNETKPNSRKINRIVYVNGLCKWTLKNKNSSCSITLQ